MYNNWTRLLRGTNEALVFKTIRRLGPISRVDIAKTTGLTSPTVTNVAAKLLETGFIYEWMTGEYSGGRRPILLDVKAGTVNMIVLHMESQQVCGYLLDADLSLKGRQILDRRSMTVDVLLEAMHDMVERLQEQAESEALLALGIIVQGPVRFAEGIALLGDEGGWRNLPLGYIFATKHRLPVIVENEMRVMTAGLAAQKNMPAVQQAVAVGVGDSLEVGIMLQGEVYRGSSGLAGQLAHSVATPYGPRCQCGKQGCFQMLATESAILRMVKQNKVSGQPFHTAADLLTITQVYAAAQAGDSCALDAVQEAGRYVGQAVNRLVEIINPELVIISGGIVRGGSVLQHAVHEALSSCQAEQGKPVDLDFLDDICPLLWLGMRELVMEAMS